MFSKINVAGIVKDHLRTLVNARTNRISKEDIILFYILPFIGGILSFVISLSSASANIITILSIFVGLLLNLLVLTFDLIGKYSKSTAVSDRDKARAKLIEEIYSNISYSILISILAIALVAPFAVKFSSLITKISWAHIVKDILAFLACYFITHFAVTILMVLKRIYALLGREIRS